MSYVECMECRDRLGGITTNHLKKHGLTTRQYRRKYPAVPMVSEDHRKILRNNGISRQLRRICRKCGRPFTTGSPKAHYCRPCQRVRRALQQRKYARQYERRARNSGRDHRIGTFEKSYLKVVKGRVRGAVLLEIHVSINAQGFYRQAPFNGKAPVEYEETCIMTIYLTLWKSKPFCGGCGSELIMARENEHYTIPAEICCERCGLVYSLDNLVEIGSKPK